MQLCCSDTFDKLDTAGSELNASRASFLSAKLKNGKLSILRLSEEMEAVDSWVQNELRQNHPVIIARDSFNNLVAWAWTVPGANPNIWNLNFRWSFGDPTRGLQALSERVKNSSRWSVGVESQTFERWLGEQIKVNIPWVEDFCSALSRVKLFPHQEKAVQRWIDNNCKGIFKMCTGAGKTISSLACITQLQKDGAENANDPVFVTVPTRVLADQWVDQIKKYGFPDVLCAYNSAANWLGTVEPWMKTRADGRVRFVVSTYRTFADDRMVARLERLAKAGFNSTWIADEMHNLSSARLLRVTNQVQALFRRRIGLSATPEIEGNMSATEAIMRPFDKICATYDLADGISEGVLCQYRYHPVPAYLDPKLGQAYLDGLARIETTTDSGSLLNLYRQSRDIVRQSGIQIPTLEDILDRLSMSAEISHTLIYCPPGFSEQSSDVTDDLVEDPDQGRILADIVSSCRRRNLSVASIIGETPNSQRTEILTRFAKGEVQVLCAIGCLDEGVDVPSIKRAIVLYSIDREKQFVQRRGRILRQPRGVKKIADIYDVIILPHGTTLSPKVADRLLRREMRRYEIFSDLANNAFEAKETIEKALLTATGEPS